MMSDDLIRLECLRLAIDLRNPSSMSALGGGLASQPPEQNVVVRAQELYEFITNTGARKTTKKGKK